MSAPRRARAWAMPRPMPLVDPVTTATLPPNVDGCLGSAGLPNSAEPLNIAGFLLVGCGGRRSRAAFTVNVMGDDAQVRGGAAQALRIGERAADVVQPAFPGLAHRLRTELVVFPIDRQSGVLGKRVARRVDLGCRRIIK